MTPPLRQLPRRMLHGLTAWAGALLLLVMLVGAVEAHPHGMPGAPGDAMAADEGADVLAAGCPHEATHHHGEGECCLGPCCPAAVAPVAAPAGPRITVHERPVAAPVRTVASEGQFRPPRQPAS